MLTQAILNVSMLHWYCLLIIYALRLAIIIALVYILGEKNRPDRSRLSLHHFGQDISPTAG